MPTKLIVSWTTSLRMSCPCAFRASRFLVEGTTESSVFYGIGDKTAFSALEAAGVSIVPVGGKTLIPLAHAILTSIGIPVYSLFDADVDLKCVRRPMGKPHEKIEDERKSHVATN